MYRAHDMQGAAKLNGWIATLGRAQSTYFSTSWTEKNRQEHPDPVNPRNRYHHEQE